MGRRLHSKRKWEHENSRYAEVKPVGCNAHMYSVWNPEGRHLIWEVRKRALSETRPTEPPRLLVPLIAAHRRAGAPRCARHPLRTYIHTPPALPCCRGGCPPAFLMCVWLRRPLRLSYAAPPHAEMCSRALCYTGGARGVPAAHHPPRSFGRGHEDCATRALFGEMDTRVCGPALTGRRDTTPLSLHRRSRPRPAPP